jgi:hypothetical protein
VRRLHPPLVELLVEVLISQQRLLLLVELLINRQKLLLLAVLLTSLQRSLLPVAVPAVLETNNCRGCRITVIPRQCINLSGNPFVRHPINLLGSKQ